MATYDRTAIIARYAAGEAVRDIAADLGCTSGLVCHHAHAAGLPRRRMDRSKRPHVLCGVCYTPFLPPSSNPGRQYCSSTCRNLGAGRNITIAKIKPYPTMSGAYRTVRVPSGHISRTTTRRKRNDRAPEHVIIAESALGRALKVGEVVHHVNCNQTDNRPQNLLICSRSYHAWLHGEMSRRWARGHFA